MLSAERTNMPPQQEVEEDTANLMRALRARPLVGLAIQHAFGSMIVSACAGAKDPIAALDSIVENHKRVWLKSLDAMLAARKEQPHD